MTKLIACYGIRGGLGQTTLALNLAVALSQEKKNSRVGVVELNWSSPSFCGFFPTTREKIYLNHYLAKKQSLTQATYTIRKLSDIDIEIRAIPCSPKLGEMVWTMGMKLDLEYLCEGLYRTIDEKRLDYVILDLGSGLHRDTLSLLSIADHVILMSRLDRNSFDDFPNMLQTIQQLDETTQPMPKSLVINFVPPAFENLHASITQEIQDRYKLSQFNITQTHIFPYTSEIMETNITYWLDPKTSYTGFVVLDYPKLIWCQELKSLLDKVV